MEARLPEADLSTAERAVDTAQAALELAARHLAAQPDALERSQVACYDLAHSFAGLAMAKAGIDYGANGDEEARIACAFAADALAEIAGRAVGREGCWGMDTGFLQEACGLLAAWRDPEVLAELAGTPGDRRLDPDFEMVAETFRRFAEDRVAPVAEQVHRTNGDIPEEVISGLAEIGGFGLSVPEAYGGFAQGGDGDYLAMVVATEELSRASLGVGGSLITRPEILTRALLRGGTEDQKHHWLPRIASAEVLAAVAVTEPDFGSDVAGLKVTAVPAGPVTDEGEDPSPEGWLVNGVKTWCTFAARADVLMLLARTDPDRSVGHKGLSIFMVEKEVADGKGFLLRQDATTPGRPGSAPPGRLEGRPIDTIGYRGMHSYELAFENWWVPATNLLGRKSGLGKGFYYQMEGFENGRLQTAARAVGIMQAAYEAALSYAQNRVVFGRPIWEYQLTRVKLARMAVVIQTARQFAYEVARLMAKGSGSLEASMVKAYVCRAAEWVTREAMQLHGGMGYAEEFPVSRYFVDARVLSIFEGADETLALKVIARRLLEAAH